MQTSISIAQHTRSNFIKLVDALSIEQLNKIPPGFNNNIAWNFCHIVASQQVLCYEFSNLPVLMPAELTAKYRRGTKPEAFIPQTEMEEFKKLAVAHLIQLENDLQHGVFKTYNGIVTTAGLPISNLETAVHYISTHDALHYGYAMALKRMIQ